MIEAFLSPARPSLLPDDSSLQEALPMTDVLVMVDDSYADEPTVGGS